MLKLGIVANAPYTFDARLLQVLADGHQLILVQLLVGGIDADIARLATTIATLHKAKMS